MASTYTDLGLELMTTGENAGTWGTKTNNNLTLIEQLTGGVLSLSIAGGAGTQGLTVTDGDLAGTAQQRVIEFTGSITGNRIITWPVLTENFYIIKNSTSGAYTVQLKAASGSGATVTFSTTEKGYKIIYLDGVATNTGVYDVGIATLAGVETLTNKTLTSPVFSGTATNFKSTGIDDNATSTAITINSSEQVEFTAGTALLPAITTTGDANTGMWFPDADTIAFSEGGSEVMRIDSSGNVGIGTSSPINALHIVTSDAQNLALEALRPTLFFKETDGNANENFQIRLDGGDLEFQIQNDAQSSATTKMIIDSSGKVGIGTASPSQALDVVGSIEVSDGIYIGGTAAANKLDDYEEGSWTPTYASSSGSFTSITYGIQRGAYTKVGRQVTCLLQLRTSAITVGTATDSLWVEGLPFTVSSDSDNLTYTPLGISDNFTNKPSTLRPHPDGTYGKLSKDFDNSSSLVSDMGTGTVHNFIALEFTYFTD